jgi:hypothetical protein
LQEGIDVLVIVNALRATRGVLSLVLILRSNWLNRPHEQVDRWR